MPTGRMTSVTTSRCSHNVPASEATGWSPSPVRPKISHVNVGAIRTPSTVGTPEWGAL
jgi:hypothetical protein